MSDGATSHLNGDPDSSEPTRGSPIGLLIRCGFANRVERSDPGTAQKHSRPTRRLNIVSRRVKKSVFQGSGAFKNDVEHPAQRLGSTPQQLVTHGEGAQILRTHG